ncbi:hypothetical protein HID58_041316 [Brassica napus]|uniref:Uncharacterized protein n=1 Tax=Brassica napus TaxID=3708 RepID=A0ABQ8BAR7_BRANA|nr:hypothetical protein HID58_041316 [Brassica napus]
MISSSSKPQGLVEALTESTVLVHGIEEITVTTSPATVSPVKSCLPSLVTLSNPSSTALGENQMQLETAVVEANKAVVDKDIVPGHGSNHLPALKGAWVKKLNVATSSHHQTQVGVPLVNHNPPRMEDDARFPWAAKMNPSSRNLYRATEPEYLEDGTPKTNTLLKSVQPDTSLLPSSDTTLSPPSSKFCLESSVVDIVNGADVEDLVSLATISVLENMYMSPSIICINELLSLRLWSLPQHCHSSTLPLLKPHLYKIGEHGLCSNKFASLISLEGGDEDPIDSDEETYSMDLMTLSGKRIFRERPVKPSTKAREMHLQFTTRGGRGNRGRGNRGRGNRGASG